MVYRIFVEKRPGLSPESANLLSDLRSFLGITALETRTVTTNNKTVLLDTDFLTPVDQMLVDQVGQFLSTGTSNQCQRCFLSGWVKKFCRCNDILRHDSIFPPSQ